MGFAELAVHVSKEWKRTTAEKRLSFYKLQHQDGERHKREMDEYRALLEVRGPEEILEPRSEISASTSRSTVLAPAPSPRSNDGVGNATAKGAVPRYSPEPRGVLGSASTSTIGRYIQNASIESQRRAVTGGGDRSPLRSTEDVLEPLFVFPEQWAELALNENGGGFSKEEFNELW